METMRKEKVSALSSVHVDEWTKQNGIRIRKAREQKGLTVEAVCRTTGISNIFLYERFEKGKQKPRDEQLRNIMFRLGMSPEDVFGPKWNRTVVPAETAAAAGPAADNKAGKDDAVMSESGPEKAPEKNVRTPELSGTIGGRLKAARLRAGLTWNQIADRSGLTDVTVRSYEKDVRLPSQAAVTALARCYSCQVYDLVTRGEYRNMRKQFGNRKKDRKAPEKEKPAGSSAAVAADERPAPEQFSPAETVPEAVKAAEDVPAVRDSAAEAVTVPAAAEHAETAAETAVSREAERLGGYIRSMREKAKLTERQAAEHLGISETGYRKIEDGTGDITLSQFCILKEKLLLDTDVIAKEIFARKWRTYMPQRPIDRFSVIGVCEEYHLPYKINEDFIRVYCDAEEVEPVIRNLGIKGTLF